MYFLERNSGHKEGLITSRETEKYGFKKEKVESNEELGNVGENSMVQSLFGE